jgi:hypothetical protein
MVGVVKSRFLVALLMADGLLPRIQIRWPLVKFKLNNQGKHVILLRLNLYSQSLE